jgi:hypothetical protein
LDLQIIGGSGWGIERPAQMHRVTGTYFAGAGAPIAGRIEPRHRMRAGGIGAAIQALRSLGDVDIFRERWVAQHDDASAD